MTKLLRLNPRDNVAVALVDLQAGEVLSLDGRDLLLREDVKAGHKVALTAISSGGEVIKYGFPIGVARRQAEAGQWVHTHNLASGLGGFKEYTWQPAAQTEVVVGECANFLGYRRPDGQVGVRNEIWVVPTVGCVNQVAENLVRAAGRELGGLAGIDGFYALRHPLGCSQLGDDHLNTQKLLGALAHHPNAGAVPLLGLGRENNNRASFCPHLERFLTAQEMEDEHLAGLHSTRREVGCSKR